MLRSKGMMMKRSECDVDVVMMMRRRRRGLYGIDGDEKWDDRSQNGEREKGRRRVKKGGILEKERRICQRRGI
jgi:hypothetical protein